MNGETVTRNLSMIDPSDIEKCAMDDAGTLGGAYLDSIGKTDLATLTKEEWNAFIEVVCGGYAGSMIEASRKALAVADMALTKAQGVQGPGDGLKPPF